MIRRASISAAATIVLVSILGPLHPDWQGWIFLAGFAALIFGTLYSAFRLIDGLDRSPESGPGDLPDADPHEHCNGIHRGREGYLDCDSRPI